MNKDKEIETTESPTQSSIVQYQNPLSLIALAIDKDIDIDRLSKLMDLSERWEKNEAKKAFVKAMTEFKKNPPKIYKDMLVEFQTSKGKTSYTHASLGNAVASLTERLAEFGISSRWSPEIRDNKLFVTNILTHELGHSESVTLSGPPDNSGTKNPIQAMGSTQTYLERYTFLANVGLATNEYEDDGRQGQRIPIPVQNENGKTHNPINKEKELKRFARYTQKKCLGVALYELAGHDKNKVFVLLSDYTQGNCKDINKMTQDDYDSYYDYILRDYGERFDIEALEYQGKIVELKNDVPEIFITDEFAYGNEPPESLEK